MSSKLPLPPGKTGWPVLGETLPLLKDGFGFMNAKVEELGPHVRTSVLGRDTVITSGPEGTDAFNDESRVQRDGGMPPHIEQLFGGKSLPIIDGEVHRVRKEQVVGAFRRDALDAYLPAIQASYERCFDGWAKEKKAVAVVADLKRLGLEIIAKNMLSLDPGADVDTVIESFEVLARGFGGLPIPIPGTAFSKAIAARDRIFAILERVIAEHRAKRHDDGLSRMLETKAHDGTTISDEHAILELHHFNIAGYIIFAHFQATLVELARQPDVLAKLRAECAVTPRAPLTVAALEAMPYLNQVVKEIKRYAPFAPMFFGKAKKEFELGGYRVPEGWMILWAHHASHVRSDAFADAARFDPDRFSPARAEDEKHPCAYAPQGAGELTKGHKCAGYDYGTLMLQALVAVLARDYAWVLPEQELELDFSKIPPEYKSGLLIQISER